MPNFQQSAADAERRITQITESGMTTVEQLLTEVQQTLVLRLADAPTEYGAWFYGELLTDARQMLDDTQRTLTQDIEQGIERTIDVTEETVTQAIIDYAGSHSLTVDLPHLSRQALEMLTTYMPGEKISGLFGKTKTTVVGALQQALLGATSPWDLQKFLGATLTTPGPFNSTRARAEAIWRTEALRFYNTLARQRYNTLDQLFPDEFEKVWLHSGNTRWPRQHHQALNGTAVGMREKFLVGTIACDGPHDSVLPASEIIRCGCSMYVREKKHRR